MVSTTALLAPCVFNPVPSSLSLRAFPLQFPLHTTLTGVTAQVWGQRVVVGRPDWVLSQLPSSQSGAAAAAHLQQQLVPPEASGAKLTQVCWSVGRVVLVVGAAAVGLGGGLLGGRACVVGCSILCTFCHACDSHFLFCRPHSFHASNTCCSSHRFMWQLATRCWVG